MAVPALPSGYALQEYRIERLLGAGGFGLTYLAIDTNLNLRVAIKEYLPSDIAVRNPDQSVAPNSTHSGEDFMWGKRRFLDESRTIASFRHPNIVRVMRFFEAKGSAYMVMEYVEGDALPDWIKPRRPLPEAQIMAIAGPLLEGLQVVHTTGYLHRDIKPGNIYVRYDGSPVLLDFGAARQDGKEDLTAIVTPGYAPFEQYHSHGQQGPWSDVYAFAGVLYWMVTGQRPLEAAARVREDTLPPAVKAGDRNRYRPELLAAIDWALALHENDRPQSVHEWRAALAGTLEPKLKHAEPPPPPPAPVAPAVRFDANFLDKVERELAQHVGPIAPVMVKKAAKKAQDPAELVQLLAADITHNGLRLKFERRFADQSRPVSRSQPASVTPTSPSGPPSGAPISPEILSRAEAQLAQYLGPVAKVVVKRAALKARDASELYLLIADEIEDPVEKKAFIRRRISTTSKV